MTFCEAFDAIKKKLMSFDYTGVKSEMAVQFVMTGDGEGVFYAYLKDGQLAVEPYDYKDNTVTVEADSSVLLEIAEGDADVAAMYNKGQVKVKGNVTKLLELSKAFKKVKKAEAAKTVKAEEKPAETPAKEAETPAKEDVKAETKSAAPKKPAAKPVAKKNSKKK